MNPKYKTWNVLTERGDTIVVVAFHFVTSDEGQALFTDEDANTIAAFAPGRWLWVLESAE